MKSGFNNIFMEDVFHHPRVAELAALLASKKHDVPVKRLDPEPFSLLSDVERESTVKVASDICGVSVELIEDMYPCTALQEGVIALSAKKPGTYTGQLVFKLPDSIDLDRFKAAWQATADANPILRTRIIQTESWSMFPTVLRMNIAWDEGKCLEEYISDRSVRRTMGIGSPLARFAIMSSSSRGSRTLHFVLTMHYALGDG